MIVTDIVEINNKKCKVFIDCEFAFAVYKGELRSYHIKKDCEIATEDYKQLTEVVLPKRAKLRAMNLLKTRSYTRKQLENKLRDNYYNEEFIEEALSYVERFGYVNDLQYAIDFITYRANQLNRKQLEQKMMQKGISKDVMEQAFLEFYQDGNEISEKEQIYTFLQKKKFWQLEEEKDRQKVLAALMRKGFAFEMIQKVLNEQKDT